MPSINQSIYLSVGLSVCLSVCLSVYLYIICLVCLSIFPLTRKVVGAPLMISWQDLCSLSVFHSSLWLWKVQSYPLSDIVVSKCSNSHRFLSLPILLAPLTVPHKMVFAGPYDSGDMSIPLQLPSRNCSQEIFMVPGGMLGPVADHDIGCMVRVMTIRTSWTQVIMMKEKSGCAGTNEKDGKKITWRGSVFYFFNLIWYTLLSLSGNSGHLTWVKTQQS